jgi:hypothetical protein
VTRRIKRVPKLKPICDNSWGTSNTKYVICDDIEGVTHSFILKVDSQEFLHCPTCNGFVEAIKKVYSPYTIVRKPSCYGTSLELLDTTDTHTWTGSLYNSGGFEQYAYMCPKCEYTLSIVKEPYNNLILNCEKDIPTSYDIRYLEDRIEIVFNLKSVCAVSENETYILTQTDSTFVFRIYPEKGKTSWAYYSVIDGVVKREHKVRDVVKQYVNVPLLKACMGLVTSCVSGADYSVLQDTITERISKSLGYGVTPIKTYLKDIVVPKYCGWTTSYTTNTMYYSYNQFSGTNMSINGDLYYDDWGGTGDACIEVPGYISKSPSEDTSEDDRALIPNNHMFKYVIFYVRYPNMSPLYVEKLVDYSTHEVFKAQSIEILGEDNVLSVANDFLNPRILRIKHNDPSPLKSLFRVFGVKYERSLLVGFGKDKKKIEKTFGNNSISTAAQNPTKIFVIPVLQRYFKDINNLKNVLALNLEEEGFMIPIRGWNKVRRGEVKSIALLDALSVNNDEKNIFKRFLHGLNYLEDTNKMFETLGKYESILEEKIILDGELGGSIKEIHDALTRVLDQYDSKNENIRSLYTDKDLSCEMVIGDYHIKLADDTDELRTIGRYMRHCVGTSYADTAHKKHCIIASVMKGPIYKVCMELSGDGTTLKQAKTYDNKKPKGELLEVVYEFVRRKELYISTSDIEKPEWYVEKMCRELSIRKRGTRVPDVGLRDGNVVEANLVNTPGNGVQYWTSNNLENGGNVTWQNLNAQNVVAN